MIDSQDEKIKVRDRIITVIDKMIHGGSSQKSIADKIGYSQNSLNDVINSRRHMPINKINEFIKHFHISRSYIYEGIGTPFPVAQQKERGNMVMEEVISYSKGAVDF